MKKTFALVAALALLLPVLAGCRSTQNAATPNYTTETPQPMQTTPITPATAPATQTLAPTLPETKLTRDEAISIALKNAGLTREEIQDLDVELDRDDGVLHYDVDFEAGGYDYEYEIHATSGNILRSQKERD